MEENNEAPSGTVGYDPVAESYHAFHDWNGTESLCNTLVSAIGAVSGKSALEMDPLYDVVDPDELEAQLRLDSEANALENTSVSFRFEGRDVTVYASGEIVIDVSE